jgi:hypothetical protein
VFVLSCAGSGLSKGWSPVQGVLPTAWMSVCVYSVFVLSCAGSGPCDGLIPRPRSPSNCLQINKLKWNKAFQGCPMLRRGSNRKKERQRERERNIVTSALKTCQKSRMPTVVVFTRHIWNYGMPNRQNCTGQCWAYYGQRTMRKFLKLKKKNQRFSF